MKKQILLAFASTLFLTGCHSSAPADFSKAPPNPGQQFIQSMVAKYNGDASKLTGDERKRLNEITHGNADIAMRAGTKK